MGQLVSDDRRGVLVGYFNISVQLESAETVVFDDLQAQPGRELVCRDNGCNEVQPLADVGGEFARLVCLDA